MSKLMRKNLMLDDAKVKELARRRGVSESAAVREVIDHALVAEEVVEIFRELQARGGVDDVFGKLRMDEMDDDEKEIEQDTALIAAAAF